MSTWELRHTPLKYRLGDMILMTKSLALQCRSADLSEDFAADGLPLHPCDELLEGSEGFMIRSLPVRHALPSVSRKGPYLCYAPLQYRHCHIDLSLSFEEYVKRFSSKTRSTLQRKVRKYAQHCGGSIRWKTYASASEMGEFFRFAREVSRLTYQERLLDAGLPDTDEFFRTAEALAAEDRVRAYILFDDSRPVSYLYCPVKDDVLIYAYLGYDPAYMKMSVGTVLQWLALEALFGERRFRAFDFTEGDSEHKRLFATHERQCANVILLKSSLRNLLILTKSKPDITNYAPTLEGTKASCALAKARLDHLQRHWEGAKNRIARADFTMLESSNSA